ncbi:cyclodeaminase/cyclohydrolase family protein [Larkinella humicola]|uniref:ImmA/IrrE family metallo-endopeptidase n=1 Tax=Larkinella humicola TaxID=2607654 RepID=A0A5N1J999_9BACT|nr:cyclodeaminase/cyclohydrolase family protein [Larkinella humicola]KAA9349031.1 ImmA/IrrE family metallo-endopeptidase [Larkinella humicola]
MSTDLLQLPTRHLLDKIGAGNHKPGSGSAAALNGILSSELLETVIELTLEREKTYIHCKTEFEAIKNKIINIIGPRLEVLFEEDSLQFDKTIQKRKERNKERNQKIKNDLQEESLQELKRSTEIPIEIANLCIQLAKYSVVVFDKGFKSARGDSGVALGSSLSGLSGCIAIISLNLQSFPKNAWTNSIEIQKKELKNEFNNLSKENVRLMDTLDEEADIKGDFLVEFTEIRKSLFGKSNVSHTDIENLARRIQNALWGYKELIWSVNPPDNLLGVLKPQKVIELLRYAFHKAHTLGVNEQGEEIAGIINNEDYTITISDMYKPDVIKFTTAHELGHALLHDKIELHRDLPLDGSDIERYRPIEEIQADKFAAVFLMPKKIVVQLFYERFQIKRFTINENTARLLDSTAHELRKKVKNKRDLSRMIAKCGYYNSRPFDSLSKIFQVSIEAMAIRLEELELIEY